MTLREFETHGFRVFAENPPHEILIGLMGSFWKMDGGLLPIDSLRSRAPNHQERHVWHGILVLSMSR